MRYVILDPEAGVFLGTHKTKMYGPAGATVPLWSATNFFQLTKAFSFDSKKDAMLYIRTFLSDRPDIFVGEVNSKDKYVDLVDLLKSGYELFTFDMIDGLEISETIH